jgi:parvulin-like peptidyl-prolyl isomerase
LAKKKNTEKAPREMTHRALSHHKKAVRRQRFILFGGIGIIAAVIAIILIGWIVGDYLPMHKTVLQVYDQKFSASYFIDRLAFYLKSQTTADTSQAVSTVMNQILQGELEKQAAATIGVVVNADNVTKLLKDNGIRVDALGRDMATAELLPDKLKSDYFENIIPVSANQVYMKAIMTEDENAADTVRAKMLNGDNVTELAASYGQGYYTQSYKGDFGFHTADYFRVNYIPDVPIDYAFSDGTSAGTFSSPLADNKSYKQLGYWLIRVNDLPTDTTANVTAILLGNKNDALAVKARLDNGEDVAALSDEFNQYSQAKDKQGELGVIAYSDNISPDFNGYVFSPSTQLGEWSLPVRDASEWTTGGYWVVQVVDRQDNSKLTDEDRKALIDKAYNTWASGLMGQAGTNVASNFTAEQKVWVLEKATKKIQ